MKSMKKEKERKKIKGNNVEEVVERCRRYYELFLILPDGL